MQAVGSLCRIVLGVSVLLTAVAGLAPSQAVAKVSRMPFAIGGQKLDRPRWENAQGQEVQSLNLEFHAYAQPNRRAPVDSQPVRVRLKNAPPYPVSTRLYLPADCVIGTTKVADKYVRLFTNASGNFVESSGGSMSIATDGLYSFALRFSSEGRLGDRSGAVSCAQNGALTFSY